MKAFSVNTNSWHYKLNIRMVKTNERLFRDDNAEKYVKSKDNLCSYWQMTIWSIFKLVVVFSVAAAIIFFLGSLVFLYVKSIIFNTGPTLVGTGIAIGLLSALFGSIGIAVWLDKQKTIKMNKILYDGETETSLAKAKYSSWKSGICVPVEFKS